MAFAPDSQFPAQGPWAAVMIQSSLAPTPAIADVKRRMAETHPGLFVELFDFQSRIRDGLVRERLLAMLAGARCPAAADRWHDDALTIRSRCLQRAFSWIR